jgi:endonuclease/exonuclease/phosphatase family metal-dependent hydrolase
MAHRTRQSFAGNRDAWAEALAAGKHVGAGRTQRATRMDHFFYLDGGSMRLDSAEFVDTAALIGAIASDHQPFVATFTLRWRLLASKNRPAQTFLSAHERTPR